MSHLAISVAEFDGYVDPKPLANLREAVALAPASAAAHYYLGKYLYGEGNAGAKSELEQAVQLGDAQTVAAAKNILQFIH